jgi:hypothetical protein
MSRLALHLASVNEDNNHEHRPHRRWGLLGAFVFSLLLWFLVLHTLRIL